MNDCKNCTKCGVKKLLSEFYTTEHRIRNDCKECTKSTSSRNRISYTPLYKRDVISRLKSLCTKAKCRTKEFNIIDQDLIDLWGKQNGQCAYTKLPLLAAANQFNTLSLDRVDSGKGYVVGNIQLVCAAINKMKQEYTEEMFLLFCLLVTQNNKLSESPESLLARYVPLGTVDK
jgi:hypothetical protein